MMGGNYITWFIEEGSKARSLLYKLEKMGIVRLTSKTADKIDETQFYNYQWILTDKGQELINNNKCFQEIWGEGKKVDVVKFYEEVLKYVSIELEGGIKNEKKI